MKDKIGKCYLMDRINVMILGQSEIHPDIIYCGLMIRFNERMRLGVNFCPIHISCLNFDDYIGQGTINEEGLKDGIKYWRESDKDAYSYFTQKPEYVMKMLCTMATQAGHLKVGQDYNAPAIFPCSQEQIDKNPNLVLVDELTKSVGKKLPEIIDKIKAEFNAQNS